ncbi:MAG TPA: NAD(P)/FAD-dependent oxidoreductase, partial [archaeon]|nr:NAD(P)/FAD-dependent oxidoreductase [archaeon]
LAKAPAAPAAPAAKAAAKPKLAATFDAIVVGSGPGGSACARFLGMLGRKVLLLDKAKFPRDKTCGDGISGKSTRLLKELGITENIEARQHGRIKSVIFSSPKGDVIDIPVPAGAYGYCSPRLVFDNVVFEAAKATPNVKTLEQFQVSEVLKDGEKVIGVRGTDLVTKQSMEFRAPVTVGADGATSVVAKAVGQWSIVPEHLVVAIRMYYKNVTGMKEAIEMHFLDEVMPGYFWLFPVGDGLVNVGSGMLMSDLRERHVNLEEATLNAIKSSRFAERFKDAEKVSPTQGWNLPVASYRRTVAGEGWVLVGDAASLIDPFTGEGIGNALLSGKLAAQTIDKALRGEAKLMDYHEQLWSTIGNEIATSYRMQKWGKRKWLLNAFIRKAAKRPELREYLSSTLASEEIKKGLVSPWKLLTIMLKPA